MRNEEEDRLTDVGLAALSEFLTMHEGVGKRFTVRELQAFIYGRTAEAAGLDAIPTPPKTAWGDEDLDVEVVSLGNGQFEIDRRRPH
ncbi:MAG: hypothetical protein ABSB35_14170 [Bryobacteraceae bacterium]|jgi:hypothetical protein